MKSPDLSGFKQRGGKMIAWIGNADAAVSSRATIDRYKSIDEREGGKAADFVRLFVIPGMNHCAGGVATDRFDMLKPLEDWVERGIAPRQRGRRGLDAGLLRRRQPHPAAVPIPAIRALQQQRRRHQHRQQLQLPLG